MDIKPSDIVEFKALYKRLFGINLTDKLALIKLSMLVRQLELTYKPITQADLIGLKNVNGNVNDEQLPSAS